VLNKCAKRKNNQNNLNKNNKELISKYINWGYVRLNGQIDFDRSKSAQNR
jgi:hypothetical protein